MTIPLAPRDMSRQERKAFRTLAQTLADRGVDPVGRAALIEDFVRLDGRLADLRAAEKSGVNGDKIQATRALTTATQEKRRLHDALFKGAARATPTPATIADESEALPTAADDAWRLYFWQGDTRHSYDDLERLHGHPDWPALLFASADAELAWRRIAADYPQGKKIPADVLKAYSDAYPKPVPVMLPNDGKSGWNFACPDWADRLESGLTLMPALPLVTREAERAAAIFDKLHLPDVVGRPTMRDAAGDWLREIVRAIFGSLIDGHRMVPELLAMLPKKNSKTTGGAAITLTGLLMNIRPRASFIYVGPTQEVADEAFQQTEGMIEADGYLTEIFHIARHVKTITDRLSKTRLKVKTFDLSVVTGSKPAFVLLDELHLMSAINGAGRILGQIRGGLQPNPEAVLVMITTQSDQPPAGVFKAELQYARGVRDGRIASSRLLAILYEFSEAVQRSGDWRNPALWSMVQPNLNRPITIARLLEDYETAKEKGEEEERRWASQHLNEVGIALHADRWPGADFWETTIEPGLTLDALLARCDVAVVGGDGGGLDDLLGLAVLGRDRKTRHWLLWIRAWAHPIVLQRRKEIAETLKDFAAQGDLIFCETPTQDVREFADICVRVKDAGLLPERGGIGIDKLGLPGLIDELVNRGFDVEANEGTITGISQGGYLNDAIMGAERKLSDGTLLHADQPVMRWNVENAKVEMKGNARAITKQAAGKGKIDLLIAALNAVKLMAANPEPKRAPTYQMYVFG